MITTTNVEYKETLKKVYYLMDKGDENITDIEANEPETIAKAVEHY